MSVSTLKYLCVQTLCKSLFIAVISATLTTSLYTSKLTGVVQSASMTDGVIELNTKTSEVNLSQPQAHTPQPQLQYGWPVSLTIPSVRINVAVSRGDYIDGEWNVSEDTAHFATMTSLPNTFDGNTIIYAHNRPHLFQNTLYIPQGGIVSVKTLHGVTFNYAYTSDQIVSPDDVSVFLYKGPPRLTLLTCHGENDRYRRLLYFDLVSVV
jgi:LPXTG-site transpeptidase (sortase) family protein